MYEKDELVARLIEAGYSKADIANLLSKNDVGALLSDFRARESLTDENEELLKASPKKSKKARNLRFGRKFLAGLLSGFIMAGAVSGFSYQLHRRNEVNRVKGYLEDFLTEDNYVDLSKISTAYDIEGFSGKYLYEALKSVQPRYVRIGNDYIFDIYDGVVVTPFKQMTAMDKSQLMGYDDDGNPVYVGYEPIRMSSEKGVTYDIPDGYDLEEVSIIEEPFDYERLLDQEIVVRENEYEDSYSLALERKK